jgi:prepilin-type N-terminal cleavage/methylation domain-containing protein
VTRNQRGFTLIEIIIAMFILAFISVFTVQSIQHALKTKAKVQGEIDKNSTVRDALRIMERDINMAFNYHDPYIALYNQAQDERLKNAQNPKAATTPPPQPGATPTPTPAPAANQPIDPANYQKRTEKIWTQFLGENEKLDFTSLSNIRMMENSPISSQAEIGYQLKPCRKRSNQEQSSNCLWRRIANYLHEDITKDGQETVLLENVTEFKLRYLGPGKEEEWSNQWLTDDRGDSNTKGKFPYAVEITLAVKDTTSKAKDKELRMTIVAAVRNPANPPEQTKDGQQVPGQAQPTQTPTTLPNGEPIGP